ncbi:hypothetical protein [Natrinema versiforme]|uniref:Uncharacterized protein n=1 Tax=Natrinema versiforme JCM 10478 TaxID=1227496 RepID=L9XP64_9EURY|nr:hypothetical protein [Natrinema versiforme]ELY63584.1 hypothetical protein C489_18596 [Natrinema versiforme JCM 10478]
MPGEDEKSDEEDENDRQIDPEIVVTASSIDGIASAIGVEMDENDRRKKNEEKKSNGLESEELAPALEALEDAVKGLEIATEKNSKGKMRKKVMEYSGRDDMANWEFGRHLEVLKTHGIAEKDGKRWRLAD